MTGRDLVKSGNVPLDRQIGGLVPGRPYLVSGGPGAGKSISCLEFLAVALDRGERAVLVTHDNPTDVVAAAEFLGIDFDQALREDRLVLFRFQLDFARRFGRAATPDEAFAELRRLIGSPAPARIAIDSIIPFLEGGGAGSGAMFALTRFLVDLGATSLSTYPGDLAGLYDRRLEPLMQQAGGFFHLANLPQGRRRGLLEIRKLRYEARSVAPVRFRIEPGNGFVQDGEPNEPEVHLLEEIRRRLLLVNVGAPLPPEILRSLERQFAVTVRAGVAAAFSDLVQAGVGAMLLNVQRDVIQDGLQLVRELRGSDLRTPIIVVTPFMLRSNDRTRALRAGADDFLSLRLPEEEFAARVNATTRRGRSQAVSDGGHGRAALAQPTGSGGGFELLGSEAFRTAVTAYLGQERAPFFSLLLVSVGTREPADLCRVALENSRVDDGDLVGIVGDHITILVDAARPQDAGRLSDRIQKAWSALGHEPLDIEVIGFPAEEQRVLEMVGAAQP